MNEKQNTFRRLAEEPLLMKSMWCRFNVHNWTMWGEPYRVGSRDIQTRHCANCNKFDAFEVQVRHI